MVRRSKSTKENVAKASNSTWSLDDLIRDNSINFFLALAISLMLASLAAAGINTIWVARILLALVFCCLALLLYGSSWGRSLTSKTRWIVLAVLVLSCVAIERAETGYQPSPKRMQLPPLRLMMRPQELWTNRHPTVFPEFGIEIDYINLPSGGYASFTLDNSTDDVMLGIDGIRITNLTETPMTLSWSLSVEGEGRKLDLQGNGQGRWNRKLNQNDWMADRSPALLWRLSPQRLEPTKSLRGAIGFVVPNADDDLRSDIVRGQLDRRYRFVLRIKNLDTSKQIELQLPSGIKPTPNVELRKAIEEMSKN